ncbi:MAG: GTPase HflX [Thermoplasmatales archaeon]|nr:GTPase HflX [Thermoplasmatales archaeon]
MKGIVISTKEDVSEIISLVESLNYEIDKVFIQKKGEDPSYYIGKGKIEGIKKYVRERDIKIAFVNDSLRPSQWYNLEKSLGIEVYDRIRLILEIFTKRAKRKEAKLQVNLAKLQYEKPFVRELFHRTSEKERPGFLGGGEYVVADYYEMIKRRIKKIKEELKRIEGERGLMRKERKEKGFYVVSITGYTNAGKSSILKALTGGDVEIDNRLFTTLSTKTKKLNDSLPILLIDTVGFIRDLPHWLISAFHSTLEEISFSDLILLVVDSSDDKKSMTEKINTSLKEIYMLKEEPKIIIVMNKIDKIDKIELEEKIKIVKENFNFGVVPVSAMTGENINLLIDELQNSLPFSYLEICIPKNEKSFISWICKNSNVLDFSIDVNANLKVKCSEKVKEIILGKCNRIGGEVRIWK